MFAVIAFALALLASILYTTNGVTATEDFRGYFGVDLLDKWSLSEDEKAVLKPSVEKRLTELKENYLIAVNEREKWAEKPHPDKTVAEVSNTLKDIKRIEETHRQAFDRACYAAKYWGVIEKCDFIGAKEK